MVNAVQMTSETLAYATLGGLAIALLVSIYTDIRYRLIFNKINIAIAIGAPLFWLASGGFNLTDISVHLLTAAITFSVFAVAFHFGAMGGGDVKLFAAWQRSWAAAIPNWAMNLRSPHLSWVF